LKKGEEKKGEGKDHEQDGPMMGRRWRRCGIGILRRAGKKNGKDFYRRKKLRTISKETQNN